MLYTNLKHIENSNDFARIINDNSHVVIVCGRMDSNSITIYRIMEALSLEYSHVVFYDMELDNPALNIINSALLSDANSNVPCIAYYKNGKEEKSTSGLQSKAQIEQLLTAFFEPVSI